MCGMVGYVGPRPALPVLLSGLARLEYRGYDSAGVAVLEGGRVLARKREGRLSRLEAELRPYLGASGSAAYSCQVAVLALLALHLGRLQGTLPPEESRRLGRSPRALPALVDVLVAGIVFRDRLRPCGSSMERPAGNPGRRRLPLPL